MCLMLSDIAYVYVRTSELRIIFIFIIITVVVPCVCVCMCAFSYFSASTRIYTPKYMYVRVHCDTKNTVIYKIDFR